MRSHLHRPRRDRSRMAPPKAGTAPEPVVQLVGLHTPATSGCSCGGRCPRCQRRANAKTALAALGRNGRTAGHALPLSVPGDHFERQAQRVAERVANTPPGAMTAPDRIDGETPAVQRAPALAPAPVDVSGAPPSVRAALASVGRPLEPTVRGDMERRLGLDLGHVRIHDGAVADASARVLGARAYTIGAHVVFRGGAFDPATCGGRRLLAHELVHVAQHTRRSRTAAAWWRPLSGRTMIQGDLAIRPPRGDRDGRTLGAAEMTAALDFNRTYFANLPNSAALIEVIRDTIGTNRTPAVIDQDFVRAVVTWQAMFGLGQDGKLGPRTARPLFRELGAERAGKCAVASGPRYNTRGPLNVARAGTRTITFNLLARFKSDPANGIYPSCCEVRQDIQWDAAFVTASVGAGNGRVPHAGFPAAHPSGRWIEDRDTANTRYGHRSGRFSAPGRGDRYLDSAGHQNSAFGHRYRGQDNPLGLAADRGAYLFRLRVVDVCNRGRRVARSRTLRLNWL